MNKTPMPKNSTLHYKPLQHISQSGLYICILSYIHIPMKLIFA
ncbi:hypothetical protein XIS1_490009 [Xenorhabdus innexi]|uniref:Uncharacterized protein n=1 Tax=Xenorhabdus innexi TaxID=290109 RepID=A0A1N6MYX8_9GAMM|nr:hypothetical protein XIS1_490009 [Xenorhabdus innexi]